MSKMMTAKELTDKTAEELIEEAANEFDADDSENSNSPGPIDRGELVSRLSDVGIGIDPDSLDGVGEEKLLELWQWMEANTDFAEGDDIMSDWLAILPPGFSVVEVGEGGATAIIRVSEQESQQTSESGEEGAAGETLTETPPEASPQSNLEERLREIFEASAHANKLRSILEDAESETKAAKAREKECLENLHAAEKELSRVIADAKSGQKKLPFGDGGAAPTSKSTSSNASEPGEAGESNEPGDGSEPEAANSQQDWPISELGSKAIKSLVGADVFEAAKEQDDPIGLSENQLDKFSQVDVSTICGLEKFIRDEPFWHQKIKGFGDAAIQRVISTLVAFRKVRPV